MQELLLNKLYAEIPITRHMGFRVEKADNQEVIIFAPLEPNINHKATVFGGALASALLLSAWCLTENRLKEWGIKGHVVVMKSQIEYLLPVENDFRAICSLTNEKEWETFRNTLERKKKARIRLEGSVNTNGTVAVKFQGLFVALKDN